MTPDPSPPEAEQKTPLISKEEILGRNTEDDLPGIIRSAMAAVVDQKHTYILYMHKP